MCFIIMNTILLNGIINSLSRDIVVTEDKQVAYRMLMPESMRSKFKSLCALEQVSMNEILIQLVSHWIEEKEKSNENQS